jgi:hypothetical protein
MYKIAIGLHDRANPETTSKKVNVEQVILHPEYNSATGKQNDIALIKLLVKYSKNS